jgi:hypothetical protein
MVNTSELVDVIDGSCFVVVVIWFIDNLPFWMVCVFTLYRARNEYEAVAAGDLNTNQINRISNNKQNATNKRYAKC